MGVTHGPDSAHPAVDLHGRPDGAISADGQVMGNYLHGLFDAPAARDALLRWAGLTAPKAPDYRALRDKEIDRLADMLEQHLNLEFLLPFARGKEQGSKSLPLTKGEI